MLNPAADGAAFRRARDDTENWMNATPWMTLALGATLALTACSGGETTTSPAPADAGEAVLTKPPAPTMPKAEVIGETLATVDGLPIGSKEFDGLAARRGREAELDAEARAEIMDRLVEEKLLYQEALRQGIDKDPKIQKMMVNTLLKQDVYSTVKTSDITEEDLQAYFAEHIEDFVVPEKAQIKRLVIAPEGGENATDADKAAAKAKAAELRDKVLARKADFRKLAQEHSAGAYARRGGDLGFVTRDGKPGIPKEVVDIAFSLEKGGVSELFETPEGWNFVYVPNRRDRVERTFEQMRGSVLRKVKSDTYKSLYDQYVGKLRESSSVSIDEAKLAGHKVSAPTAPTLSAPGDDPDDAADERSGEDEQ